MNVTALLVGSKVWYSAWLDGPLLWHVEITLSHHKLSSYGRILSLNNMPPEPIPDDVKSA